MKRILSVILAVIMLACFCSCDKAPAGGDTTEYPSQSIPSDEVNYPNASNVLNKPCADIIADVYSRLPKGGKAEPYISGLINIELTNENADYYIGVKEGVPYSEGVASESEIQPVTYSFVIVKLTEGGESYETYRERIEKNINLSKWVCMGAPVGKVLRINGVIAVIMGTAEVCGELENAFMALAGQN